jgi:hypothetical protein
MTFRFVGSELQIGHVVLKAFGQSIELDADVAKELIAHELTAPLLPDADFAKIGFTSDELKWLTSEAFAAKRKQAWAALHDLRERLLAGGSFEKESE